MKKSTIARIVSRSLLYLGIALSFLVCFALVFALYVKAGVPDIPVGWFGLAGFTPLIFWHAVRNFRRFWRQPRFWLVVAALFALHVLSFIAILLRYPQWPLLWFAPVSMLEIGLLMPLLGNLFKNNRPRLGE